MGRGSREMSVGALPPSMSACKPVATMLPILEWGWPGKPLHPAYPGVLSVGQPKFVRRGAVAIRHVLRRIGISPGNAVLLPAFHCPSMVAPVVHAGARPEFYGITEDFRVTVEEIARRLTPATRAILVPHFFGVLQDLRALRDLCDEKQVVLIEDCAHAMFGAVAGQPVGSVGHYAIASPRKFVCVPEGGILTSASEPLADVLQAPASLTRAMRMAYDAVDVSVSRGRLAAFRPLVHGIKFAWQGARSQPVGDEAPAAHDGAVPAVHASVETEPLPVSRGLERVTTRLLTDRVMQRRRDNFQRLLEGVRSLPGVSVPVEMLEDGAMPYALPLVIPDPVSQFSRLKERGLPMWRWEHSQAGVCRVTDWYATALIQVPCHQSLVEGEIGRIIGILEGVLGGRT